MVKYLFEVTVDSSKLLPSVGEVIDNVNENMKAFGFDEKLVVRTAIGNFSIESDKPLLAAQLEHVRAKALKSMQETRPEWKIEIGPARMDVSGLPI